jgi:hypothetical protein
MSKNPSTSQTEAVKKVKSLLGDLVKQLSCSNFRCYEQDNLKPVVTCDVKHASFDVLQVRWSYNESFEVRLIKIGESVPFGVLYPFESNFYDNLKRYL